MRIPVTANIQSCVLKIFSFYQGLHFDEALFNKKSIFAIRKNKSLKIDSDS